MPDDGTHIDSDIIVTATGLSLQFVGGAELSVDGEKVEVGKRFIYRGMMIEGVPNLAVCIGYTNASWTLRSDLSCRIFARFMNHLREHRYAFGYPVLPGRMQPHPALELQSGYVKRGADKLPKSGDRRPWFLRQNYILDRRDTKAADITKDMIYVRSGEIREPNGDVLSDALVGADA
jgi:monooxygenase